MFFVIDTLPIHCLFTTPTPISGGLGDARYDKLSVPLSEVFYVYICIYVCVIIYYWISHKWKGHSMREW